MRQIVILLGLLLFVTPAFAGSTPSEADLHQVEKLAAKAAIAYDKGDYKAALELYRTAHNLWKNPKLSFAMVKCLEALKNYKEALLVAKQGLSEKPTGTTKARLSSKIIFLKNKLAQGQLTLLITPSGSTVKIDGVLKGKAPLETLKLKAGKHNIELNHNNYAKIVQGITVKGGEKLRLSFTLQALTGSLSITSTPSHATVEIDGKSWGKTPLLKVNLSVGSHIIQLKAPGYQTTKKQVNITSQHSENISISLGKSATTLKLKTGPWYNSWLGWTAVVLGVSAGVGGTILWLQSNQKHEDIKGFVSNPSTTTSSQKDLDTQWNDANGQEKIGYTLIGVAGALVITGTIFFITKTGVEPQKPTNNKLTTKRLLDISPRSKGVVFYATH